MPYGHVVCGVDQAKGIHQNAFVETGCSEGCPLDGSGQSPCRLGEGARGLPQKASASIRGFPKGRSLFGGLRATPSLGCKG